ncbi:helix-turn-helix transcriptional regulator [Nostoc sp. MG11]|uniref:helix-turn-helix transcriptional regulator n=1 Tax=Nostoc sp. MG11 TaxID=2721166 RepID=UPI001867C1B8|nr:helix-turn-helix transcriptional regulator [Nostoc sp. MG11]
MMADKSSGDNEKDHTEEELLIMSKTLIASVWWTKEMGERLKLLRGEESMASLAKRAGCSYQSIQHLERGEYTVEERKGLKPSVSWEKLEGICKALEISVEDFLQVQLVKNPRKITLIG